MEQLEGKRSVRNQGDFAWLIEHYRGRRLAIVAEGDSWFGYPPPWLIGPPSNILDHIVAADDPRSITLRLERNGDEALEMLSGKSKQQLFEIFTRFKDDIDILLFSGGGNDIVGAWDMPFLLESYSGQTNPIDCVRQERFERKLSSIEHAYRDLVAIRDDTGCKCPIVTHTYAIPKPSDRGAVFLGGAIRFPSWVKPYADAKRIPAALQHGIIRYLLERFGGALASIEKDGSIERFHVVDTQQLPLVANDWIDEIHLTSAGFSKVAAAVLEKIRSLAAPARSPGAVG